MIIANTLKGAYFGENIVDLVGWHGCPLKKHAEKVVSWIREQIVNPDVQGHVTLPKMD